MKSDLAIIISCFNRKQTTIDCLSRIFNSSLTDIDLQVYLMDDGSTDGTSEAVKSMFHEVNILKGDGNLYWTRGMHRAFDEAIEKDHSYYLWLNDDTHLYPESISSLVNWHKSLIAQEQPASIIVGSTCDPNSGNLTYGGYKISGGRHRLKFKMVEPTDKLAPCDTMCGNCVLIPREVVLKIGNIDPIYQHRWGDMDYGLRAKENGCNLFVAPDFVGTCEDNPLAKSWRDYTIPIGQRIRILHSIKGLHKQDWKTYVKRHGGYLWFIRWIKPYVIVVLTSLLKTDIQLASK